jgi:ceramide glucosyltransferase
MIASGEPEWPNARAYSVNALVGAACSSTLVVTDSDVRVPAGFLRRVAAPLHDPSVGLVTCLYRGVSSGGLWTDLEALGMSVELMSNVLIADMLNGMDFALGPATATRRQHIEAIGGLHETGLYYADDFALGNLMHRNGLRVVLADTVVEHIVPRSSFVESFQHQVLWLKNNRFLRVPEHLAVCLTFAIPFSALGCAVMTLSGRTVTGAMWLLLGAANSIVRSVAVGWGVVRYSQALRKAWLYPLRDLIGFATWIATWFGETVTFRGERYVLLKGGKIRRA